MRCRLVRISAPELGSTGGSSAVEQWTVKCASAAIHWSGVQISLPGFLAFTLSAEFPTGYQVGTVRLSYDHTTVKAPHPIRTAKLSTVGPDQYFGRGLQGNLGCCMSFLSIFSPGTCTSHRILVRNREIVIRSYHGESTASHPNCEVKHRWARSVLW